MTIPTTTVATTIVATVVVATCERGYTFLIDTTSGNDGIKIAASRPANLAIRGSCKEILYN